MAICIMVLVEYLDEPINDMGRLMQIFMLHDVVEIYAGDIFMPIYHNYMTEGLRWRELGATKEKVLKRCENIKMDSEKLYDFMYSLIDNAVNKGWLPTY